MKPPLSVYNHADINAYALMKLAFRLIFAAFVLG
jgi:hypothetical protein